MTQGSISNSILYRDMLIQMKRVRNVCQRVKNSTKEDSIGIEYLRHSERRILNSAMSYLGIELTKMLDQNGDHKLGFLFLSMIMHFGIEVEDWDRDYNNRVWFNLLRLGEYHAADGVIDMSNYQEYVNTLWTILEVSPKLFSNRLALFKLGLV